MACQCNLVLQHDSFFTHCLSKLLESPEEFSRTVLACQLLRICSLSYKEFVLKTSTRIAGCIALVAGTMISNQVLADVAFPTSLGDLAIGGNSPTLTSPAVSQIENYEDGFVATTAGLSTVVPTTDVQSSSVGPETAGGLAALTYYFAVTGPATTGPVQVSMSGYIYATLGFTD